MKHIIVSVLLIAICYSCKEKIVTSKRIVTDSKLIKVFKATKLGYPNISAHRGGKGPVNYPENCLETLQFINIKTMQ